MVAIYTRQSVDKKDSLSIEAQIKTCKAYAGKNYKVYNFCNNVVPKNPYCIVCDVNGDDIAVIIEADKTLLEILERR